MNSHIAVNATLVRIGFNALMSEKIIIHGFDEISVPGEVEEKILKILFVILEGDGDQEQPRMMQPEYLSPLPHSK